MHDGPVKATFASFNAQPRFNVVLPTELVGFGNLQAMVFGVANKNLPRRGDRHARRAAELTWLTAIIVANGTQVISSGIENLNPLMLGVYDIKPALCINIQPMRPT